MLYILSPRYQLKPLTYLDLEKEELDSIHEDDYVMVKDDYHCYLINSEMHQFLNFLQTPQSKQSLTEKFTNLDWYPFFEQMLKRRILIDNKTVNPKSIITEQPNLLEPDQTLGNYTIHEHIAFRNHTQTCFAFKGNQKVFIKALILPSSFSINKRKKITAQFESEFILMQKLPPNEYLSKLIHHHKEEQYGVLEFIEGETLGKVLKNGLRNDTKEILIKQLVSALAFLHQNKVIHGDLHHKNILISPNNKLYLIDFGLSHTLNSQKTQSKKGGIDLYLPPERISKSAFQSIAKSATFHSDIYQLGVLMYYIIYENFPFDGFTWDELYDAIQSGSVFYPIINENNPLAKFINILKKCLNTNPDKRYMNASEIKSQHNF